jgi:nitroimidazol reductase NimA-like FMN-containing flavoprotein (pyridoxamine 5'-phosphate oxidase superfamily)
MSEAQPGPTEIRRLAHRAVTDRDVIYSILDQGLVCHAGYVIDERPVVIPTLYARAGDSLFLHGSNSMGLAQAVRRGSPLCVTVTLLDGIVLARSAFESSANYRSVVVHGHGRLIGDLEEKRRALANLTERLVPRRRADIRLSTEAEIRQTAVIELGLDTVSAKARSGSPEDDPADLSARVWAGVIPLRMVAGEPIPADDLAEGIEVPDYVRRYQSRLDPPSE